MASVTRRTTAMEEQVKALEKRLDDQTKNIQQIMQMLREITDQFSSNIPRSHYY